MEILGNHNFNLATKFTNIYALKALKILGEELVYLSLEFLTLIFDFMTANIQSSVKIIRQMNIGGPYFGKKNANINNINANI